MKRSYWILAFLVLCWTRTAFAMGHAPAKTSQQAHVPGEVLVQFWANVTPEEAQHLIAKAGGTFKEKIDPQRIYVVSFRSDIPVEKMVARLRAMPEVSHAEPNGVYEPFFYDLWVPSEVFAEESPGTLGSGAKVKVAVIDTAIDANHPALAGKVVPGYNVLSGTTNTQSAGIGQDWHGTASAGRILDGAGGANVEILPVQVFGTSGGASWSQIIKAINYAVDNGAQVINMSLGGYASSPLVQQAIDRATERGILVVASAGNNNTSQPAYPASMNGVISVAATNEAGTKASFSNYGPTVDISAPGDTMRLLSHGGYRMAAGTSFSAPFIAGMAALLKSAFPFLVPRQIEEIFKAKANAFPDPNQKGMGAGFLHLLDVKRWVAEIQAGTFIFPWTRVPVPPVGQPNPPVRAAQPWLVRGGGHGGDFILTPAGDVVVEEKKK